MSKMKDDEDYDTYFCCFKIKKNRSAVRSSDRRSVDVSMEQSSVAKNYQPIPILRAESYQQSTLRKTRKDLNVQTDHKKNKVILLQNKSTKERILAKVTEKYIQSELTGSLSLIQSSSSPTSLTCSMDNLRLTTPDYIARHIARRVKKQLIVVDLGCGYGGNTIQVLIDVKQFARECEYVIAIDIDQDLCLKTEQACTQAKVQSRVDIINANLFALKHLRADIVFVNPSIVCAYDIIDLESNCKPNLGELVQVCKQMAPNIVLQLPANIDISQLPIFFSISPDLKYLSDSQKYYCLEIEQIYIANVHEYNIIYIGDVAKIEQDEVVKYLAKQLNQEKKIEPKKIQTFLNLLLIRIPLYNLVSQVLESVRKKQSIQDFVTTIALKYNFENDLPGSYKKIIEGEAEFQSMCMSFQLNNQHGMSYQVDEDRAFSPPIYSLRVDDMEGQLSYNQFGLNDYEEDNQDQQYIMDINN